MSDIWIARVPVISTLHLPLNPRWPQNIPIAVGDPGSVGEFVYVGNLRSGLDAWWSPVLEWAERKGYGWIRFFDDGDIVPGLPILREEPDA